MGKLTVMLFILLFFESCKKANQSDCTSPRAESSFFNSKSIAITADTAGGGSVFYRYRVVDGGNLVFTFDYHFAVCPGTVDLDPHRTVAFQIPAGASSFDLTDSSSLRQANALIKDFCAECFGGLRLLTQGRLTGKKLNETTWAVQGAVSSHQLPSVVYKVDAYFRRNEFACTPNWFKWCKACLYKSCTFCS